MNKVRCLLLAILLVNVKLKPDVEEIAETSIKLATGAVIGYVPLLTAIAVHAGLIQDKAVFVGWCLSKGYLTLRPFGFGVKDIAKSAVGKGTRGNGDYFIDIPTLIRMAEILYARKILNQLS